MCLQQAFPYFCSTPVQAVIGSVPHADGNFDRSNNFSTTIVDGVVQIPTSTIDSFAGNVVYVIPASKSTLLQLTLLICYRQSCARWCTRKLHHSYLKQLEKTQGERAGIADGCSELNQYKVLPAPK